MGAPIVVVSVSVTVAVTANAVPLTGRLRTRIIKETPRALKTVRITSTPT